MAKALSTGDRCRPHFICEEDIDLLYFSYGRKHARRFGKPIEESEGKKWADIIRSKGLGYLCGKIRREWGYFQPDGKFVGFDKSFSIEFRSAGAFGINNHNDLTGLEAHSGELSRFINLEYIRGAPSRSNFLVMQKPTWLRRFDKGLCFSYVSWLDPMAGWGSVGTTALSFDFVLPFAEQSEFRKALDINLNLIEDVFQNVYPGFTGEKGARRMIVDKLTVARLDWVNKETHSVSFPHPVGEIPWSSGRT